MEQLEISESKILSQESGDGKEQPEIKEEIERRWLVDISKLPAPLYTYDNKRLTAKFYRDEDGKKMRIRKEGSGFFKVSKGKRTNGGMVRSIGESGDIEITAEEFEDIWEKTKGDSQSKTRHFIPIGDFVAELDDYDDFRDAGFYTIEVEFENLADCKKFVPPAWFGREVTNEKGYSSRALAKNGIPESFQRFKK